MEITFMQSEILSILISFNCKVAINFSYTKFNFTIMKFLMENLLFSIYM